MKPHHLLANTIPPSPLTIAEFNTDDRDATGWSAHAYQSAASFVYSNENTAPVLKLLDAQEGDKVVDIGCGSGEVTHQILYAVGKDGEVAAVDISSSMIAKAKSTTNMPDTHLMIGDVESPTMLEDTHFPQHLIGNTDKVFTNATLHWCKKSPSTAVENICKILKPGGLVAGEFGGFGNIAIMREAIHNALKSRGIDAAERDPWYFPSPDEYSAVLKAAGLKPLALTLFPRPTPTASIEAWIHTFAGHNLLRDLDPEVEEAIVKEATAACKQKYRQDAQGGWQLDYVRLRFTAVKEA